MTQEPQTTSCKVRKLIAKRLGLPVDEVSENRALYALGIDDLTKIELGIDIEDLFDAEAPDEAHEACKTVGDMCRLAESLVSEEVA